MINQLMLDDSLGLVGNAEKYVESVMCNMDKYLEGTSYNLKSAVDRMFKAAALYTISIIAESDKWSDMRREHDVDECLRNLRADSLYLVELTKYISDITCIDAEDILLYVKGIDGRYEDCVRDGGMGGDRESHISSMHRGIENIIKYKMEILKLNGSTASSIFGPAIAAMAGEQNEVITFYTRAEDMYKKSLEKEESGDKLSFATEMYAAVTFYMLSIIEDSKRWPKSDKDERLQKYYDLWQQCALDIGGLYYYIYNHLLIDEKENVKDQIVGAQQIYIAIKRKENVKPEWLKWLRGTVNVVKHLREDILKMEG